MKTILCINLHLFDVSKASSAGQYESGGYVVNATHNTPSTSGNDLSPQLRTFYSKYFLKNARANLVHNQFGEKETIPSRNGRTIDFRGQDPYPVATTPLVEGVTPSPNKMSYRHITAVVNQYGAFTPETDLLQYISCDDTAISDTEELADQAGRTIDVITREVINGGTCVDYAPIIASDGTVSEISSRSSITKDCLLTVEVILRMAAKLKKNNAPKFDGSYVAIVHPYVAYDLMRSKGFVERVKYADATRLFEGEIGKLGGVRFVESSEAKVWEQAGAKPTSGTAPNVYSTLFLGKHAYGVVNLEKGNLQHIVKPLGSAGAADPLDQRATRGWKCSHTAVILAQQFMYRLESASSIG